MLASLNYFIGSLDRAPALDDLYSMVYICRMIAIVISAEVSLLPVLVSLVWREDLEQWFVVGTL